MLKHLQPPSPAQLPCLKQPMSTSMSTVAGAAMARAPRYAAASENSGEPGPAPHPASPWGPSSPSTSACMQPTTRASCTAAETAAEVPPASSLPPAVRWDARQAGPRSERGCKGVASDTHISVPCRQVPRRAAPLTQLLCSKRLCHTAGGDGQQRDAQQLGRGVEHRQRQSCMGVPTSRATSPRRSQTDPTAASACRDLSQCAHSINGCFVHSTTHSVNQDQFLAGRISPAAASSVAPRRPTKAVETRLATCREVQQARLTGAGSHREQQPVRAALPCGSSAHRVCRQGAEGWQGQ